MDTNDAIITALKNVGVDTECGACMEVAFTGVTTNRHSCSDEDDMQFAFRMVSEFLDRLDVEIKALPSGRLANEVALNVTQGVRTYVRQMQAIAAEKKPRSVAADFTAS